MALKVIDKRKLKPELNHKVRNEIDIHKSLDYHSVSKVNYRYIYESLSTQNAVGGGGGKF